MTKSPSKPTPTAATDEQLVRHYNSQVSAYNEAVLKMPEKKRPETGLQEPLNPNAKLFDDLGITRKELVGLIRRQNHRLKRHIKARALELLYEKVTETSSQDGLEPADKKNPPVFLKDGKYTVGHTYQHILGVLRDEFPEASTSVACLRWYVVHEREEAIDLGLPWPDLPHFRPRSSALKAKGGKA
jgi:hypothetical protein